MRFSKSLIAVAIGFAATSAFAVNVTLYGVIETGIVAQKEKHENEVVRLGSQFDLGSRWGMRGEEELNNDYSVGFRLENGFSPKSGETTIGGSGAMFGRESVVYVRKKGLGRLGLGRAGTLWCGLGSWDMQLGYAFMGGYGLIGWPIAQNFAGNFNRVNSAIIAETDWLGPWRVGLMYSNGTTKDDYSWGRNTHYYGAAVNYKQGRVKTGGAVAATGDTYTNGEKTADDKLIVNYGLEYHLDGWTPMFAYRYLTQDNGIKAHSFGLSALVPYGNGRFKAALRYTFGRTTSEAAKAVHNTDKIKNLAAGVAYEYSLSKRTVLKPFVGYSWSDDAWKTQTHLATDENAIFNGWQAYFGIHHFF